MPDDEDLQRTSMLEHKMARAATKTYRLAKEIVEEGLLPPYVFTEPPRHTNTLSRGTEGKYKEMVGR